MTDEEVAVKLEAHAHEIGSLKHRMEKQEEQSETIQELVLSVKELAFTMKDMIKEQGIQGEKITKLESAPIETIKGMKQTIINTAVGVIAGGFTVGTILMIAQNIK